MCNWINKNDTIYGNVQHRSSIRVNKFHHRGKVYEVKYLYRKEMCAVWVQFCFVWVDNVPALSIQYIPRNMLTVFALLCFVVVIHWLIFPYPSGLLHWHCGNLTIAPVPAKQPWWIWINTSCEFIMNDYITTTKQSTTKPCAYFLGYTVPSYCLLWSLFTMWSLSIGCKYLSMLGLKLSHISKGATVIVW